MYNLKLTYNYFNTKKQNSTICVSTCNKGGPEGSFQGLHRRNSKQTKKLEQPT